MSDLSSCYFCGTALDASLERRTLAASGGEPTSVVLCPTCRRKLLGVLERALVAAPEAERDSLLATAAAAVEDEGGDAPAVADVTPDQGVAGPPGVAADADGDADAADAAGDGVETADEETSDDPAEPDGTDDDAAPSPDRGAGATTAAGETDPIFAAEGDAADDEAASGSDDTGAGETPVGDRAGDAQVPGEPADDGADAEAQADGDVVREAEPNGGDTGTEAADDAEPGPGADAGAGPAAAASPSGDGPPAGEGPDVETYNRVIRLLQNREFPVQTAEIEEVAVNAYGIDPVEFRAVIDAAVDREVIEERGDRLVRAN